MSNVIGRSVTLPLHKQRDMEVLDATGDADLVARGDGPFRKGAPVQPQLPPGSRDR